MINNNILIINRKKWKMKINHFNIMKHMIKKIVVKIIVNKTIE